MDRESGASSQDEPKQGLAPRTGFISFRLPSNKVASTTTDSSVQQLPAATSNVVDAYRDPRRARKPNGLPEAPSTKFDIDSQQRRSNDNLASQSTSFLLNLADELVQRELTSWVSQGDNPASPKAAGTRSTSAPEKQYYVHLKRIDYIDGSCPTFPKHLRARLNKFCAQKQTSNLPCASTLWPDGTSVDKDAIGRQRQWVTIPEADELEVSRYTYGTDSQLLVAKGQPGSQWECGANVVIVPASNNMYKVWHGQTDGRDIPIHDTKVLCRSVDRGMLVRVGKPHGVQMQHQSDCRGLVGFSGLHPDRQGALQFGMSDDLVRVQNVVETQLQEKLSSAIPKMSGLGEPTPGPEAAPSTPREATARTARPMPLTELDGQQTILSDDSSMKGYDSENQSVSDVPYAWAESQAETGMVAPFFARSGAVSSQCLPDAKLNLLPSRSSPPSDTVGTSSRNVLSTTVRGQRRGPQQALDDSDDEDSLPRSPTPENSPVLFNVKSRAMLQQPTPASAPGTQIRRNQVPQDVGLRRTVLPPPRAPRLQSIRPWDGNIRSFPESLREDLEKWCKRHKTNELPCAKRKWNGGDTVNEAMSKKSTAKRKRTWTTGSGDDELSVGRFRYGHEQQIIVVQARAGSLWEGGAAVIIIHSGIFSTQWKIWRGEERVEDIPMARNHVCCEMGLEQKTQVGAEENNAQDIDPSLELRRRTAPDHQQEGGRPRRTLGDRHRRQTDFATTGNGGQQDGQQPLADHYGTNTSVHKRRRPRSDSTDSDVPIAAQKRQRLWDRRDAKGRFTGDMDQKYDDTRIQVSPLATTLVVSSTDSSRAQSPPHFVDAASTASSAMPESLVKPQDLSKDGFTRSILSENRIPASDTDNVLPSATDVRGATVLFIDAAGNKALDCLWSELEDTDDLFARARVAGLISKKSRLLEVGVGNEVVLIQKRFHKDFEQLKVKMLRPSVSEIRVECGE